MREEEGTGGGVIKLTTIVTLDGLDRKAELSRHQAKKWWRVGNASDFVRKGKVHE